MKPDSKIDIIIGCGNILAGDDAVGVRAVEEFRKSYVFKFVKIFVLGTDPWYVLPYLNEARKVLIVDSIISGGRPGTVYRIPERFFCGEKGSCHSLHGFNLIEMLKIYMFRENQESPEIIIFGVEVKECSAFKVGLSSPVENAIPKLLELLRQEIS